MVRLAHHERLANLVTSDAGFKTTPNLSSKCFSKTETARGGRLCWIEPWCKALSLSLHWAPPTIFFPSAVRSKQTALLKHHPTTCLSRSDTPLPLAEWRTGRWWDHPVSSASWGAITV